MFQLSGRGRTPFGTTARRRNGHPEFLPSFMTANKMSLCFCWLTVQTWQKLVVALLISRGALVNARDGFGGTALHAAASAGHRDVAALLVAHGADINARDGDGQTPLQKVESSNDLDQATKASVAVVLQAPTRKPAQARTPSAVTTPPSPPTNIAAPTTAPACTDVAGLARLVMQASPYMDWTDHSNSGLLVKAVERLQVTLGCRQAPLATRPNWEERRPQESLTGRQWN